MSCTVFTSCMAERTLFWSRYVEDECIHVHVLKEHARSNKQTRQNNTAYPRQSCTCTCTCIYIDNFNAGCVWFRFQVETVAESLDLGQVFLLDCGDHLFVWCGNKSSLISRSKARLLAEKINKFERKNKSRIVQIRPVSMASLMRERMCVYVCTCWCVRVCVCVCVCVCASFYM